MIIYLIIKLIHKLLENILTTINIIIYCYILVFVNDLLLVLLLLHNMLMLMIEWIELLFQLHLIYELNSKKINKQIKINTSVIFEFSLILFYNK